MSAHDDFSIVSISGSFWRAHASSHPLFLVFLFLFFFLRRLTLFSCFYRFCFVCHRAFVLTVTRLLPRLLYLKDRIQVLLSLLILLLSLLRLVVSVGHTKGVSSSVSVVGCRIALSTHDLSLCWVMMMMNLFVFSFFSFFALFIIISPLFSSFFA